MAFTPASSPLMFYTGQTAIVRPGILEYRRLSQLVAEMPRIHLAYPTGKVWAAAVLLRLSRLLRPGTSNFGVRTSDSQPSARADRRALRILLVEDNPVNQLLASEVMERCGVTPQIAANGVDAVAIACGHEFDLIVMDIQMPLMDGLAATRQIRRFELAYGRQRTPVVTYTTGSLRDNEPLLDECGFDDVLDKPCTEEAFWQCLQRWCPTG